MALSLENARKIIELGKDKAARDYGRPICIAVGDEHGNLLTFDRMEGAPLRSIAISQQKAYTAIRIGIPTDAFLARLQRDKLEISYYCDPALTALPGGHPLKNKSGALIGCVGISGLAAEEDHAITEYIANFVAEGNIE
ncbi:GlcG/HbpS family heme-binding protein [Paenibacillus humicola]|uniref:GlcG/HbpS family heme-binding protein n=1 Tax=Paenibacillus humicola TaxID=3110540 RepID=UPI00237BF526|nr:heme-binding protein [Paenibacillus humicola]